MRASTTFETPFWLISLTSPSLVFTSYTSVESAYEALAKQNVSFIFLASNKSILNK